MILKRRVAGMIRLCEPSHERQGALNIVVSAAVGAAGRYDREPVLGTCRSCDLVKTHTLAGAIR
jgi:hypothetical protein